MQLPLPLRAAIDAVLDGVDREELARAAQELSQRYRAEVRDGRAHLDSSMRALAYLATRLPATYAGIRAALAATAERCCDFTPASLLDVGAGPGTAPWAACETWPTLTQAILIERSAAIGDLGKRFSRELKLNSVVWRGEDFTAGLNDLEPHDLVTLAYVLDEIEERSRDALVGRLWDLTGEVFVIVEPGTTVGWMRILAARGRLIAKGAHILAPCPHALACPLKPPDWCHFSRRVARSKLHREIKAADVPWEDEKFIYLAASRKPGAPVEARVIASPRPASGRMNVKLCRNDGSTAWRLVTRREGSLYKQARRLEWGDAI
jgi:ribosomal protein RSM22 (predicted rRNA methylase)